MVQVLHTISAVIGITAGLSNADDKGRRYLIGMAAAVQLAIFPVWLGAATVLGLPAEEILWFRLSIFLVNLGTISSPPWLRRTAPPAGARLETAKERTRGRAGVSETIVDHGLPLRVFLLGNFRPGLARLAESNRDRLFSACDFLAAARLQRAAFVLLHDLVDLAFAFRGCV